ncbi:MAG: hypothetical protein JO110_15570 [Acetobacteraceae bacterium]|nr:hypothetical protein [Acetobacteraceae bacterium]
MIGETLGVVHRLDDWLRERLGRPYHAALGVGLVWEIIARVRELHDAPATTAGIVRLALVMVLYLLLLVHQIGELSEHAERRRRRVLRDY